MKLKSIPCSGCRTECLSELSGTYLLVFLGPASIIIASFIPSLTTFESLAFVALVFGCVVASVIILLGKHSGAHINPAVTVALSLAGTHSRRLLIPYVAFQLAGALLAGLSLRVLFGSLGTSTYLGSTRLALGITPVEGVALEALGTFSLAFAILLISYSFRSPVKRALLIGATLTTLILFIGPLTGASFNPARSLGPSLFSGYFANEAVFWVGPLVGAVFAGLIFRALIKARGRNERLGIVCVC